MKLEIEKNRVLKAAEQCLEVKAVLKTLFPEAFEEDKKFKVGSLFRLIPEEGRSFTAMLVNMFLEGGYGVFSLINIEKGTRVTSISNIYSYTNDVYITPKEFLSLIPDGYSVYEINTDMRGIMNEGVQPGAFKQLNLKKLKHL